MQYDKRIREYTEKFNVNDEKIMAQFIGNSHAAEWLTDNAPVFECPDKNIEETYWHIEIRNRTLGYARQDSL